MNKCNLSENSSGNHSNSIEDLLVELQKHMYEIKSEYIQLANTLEEERIKIYQDKMKSIQNKIDFLTSSMKKNIYYLSDLNEKHIRQIKSAL